MTIAGCIALFLPALAHAQAAGVAAPAGPSAVQFAADALSGSAAPGARQPLSLSLQVLVLMTLLSVLPAVILMMTYLTRIIIRSEERSVGERCVNKCRVRCEPSQ